MAAALASPADVTDRPAHRDGNVLRWLAAYTSSMVGDSVYYIALSWAAVRAGTPAEAGLVMTASAVPRALRWGYRPLERSREWGSWAGE